MLADLNFPTLPVQEIVGTQAMSAFNGIQTGSGAIAKRGSISLSGPLDSAQLLTEFREMSSDQIVRLKSVLLAPKSYWIGHPVYRRFPPKPGFIFRLKTSTGNVDVAADLQNPGWRIDACGRSYWAFTFAGDTLRSIAKELFSEFASRAKNATWMKGMPKMFESVDK